MSTSSPSDTVFPFRPIPLLSSPNAQTFLAYLLPGPDLSAGTREHLLSLPDGDSLVLHDTIPAGWSPGKLIVLLLHGLTGSAQQVHVRRLAGQLLRKGVRVVRLDQRGFGRSLPLARRLFHAAGHCDDVRGALAEIHRWSPHSPLALLGVSLGGNLALRAVGELPERSIPGLVRVAALAPPIDLEACLRMIELPRNRVYERFFVQNLLDNARQRQQLVPRLPPLCLPRRLRLRRFDECYTAPRCGFADAEDYYRRMSSMPLIERISVPTLIVTARDDPFVGVQLFERLGVPEHIRIRIPQRGGHLGFVGRDGGGGWHWAERHLAEWISPRSTPDPVS